MTLLQRFDSPTLPLIGPSGFPTAKYVERLRHPYMTENSRRAREFRFEVCRTNPILFGLHYLRPHLTITDAQGRQLHTLAAMHVEIASAARRWAVPNLGPKAVRDAWVWPRRSGKTCWAFLLIPLWALAFEHRKYLVFYSDVKDQSERHLSTLKMELVDNERLRRDFPNLCEPLRTDGHVVRNSASAYLARSSAMIEAKGMNSATLGVKFRERRPDALALDEIEPVEGRYSPDLKKRRLIDMIDGILPCNEEAVVSLTGTTVAADSIMHDVIRGETWVQAERFAVHHTPGIVADPITGEETSCWPARWDLEYLRNDRLTNPRSHAKNFENAPIDPDGTFWTSEHIAYKDIQDSLTDRILVIDPAAKSGRKNDETGIGKFGFDSARQQMVVEDVVGVRLPPDQLRARVRATVEIHKIRTVLVDVTNGGSWVVNGLDDMPRGTRIVPVHIGGRSKLDRITELHDRYLRTPPMVVHARPIPKLESLLCSYPNVMFDDQIDVVALAAQWFIDGPAKVGK